MRSERRVHERPAALRLWLDPELVAASAVAECEHMLQNAPAALADT